MNGLQDQHEIAWTSEKSANFWAYVARSSGLEETYFGKHAGRSVIETVKSYIPLQGKIIDYGCGPGMFMEHLFAAGISCMGLDFSRDSLEVLEKKFRGNRLLGGVIHVTSLPIPVKDKSTDVVFFLETIEHLLVNQLDPTLDEISRIVRPGGYIVVTTPNDERLSASKVICPECGCIFHRWQHINSFTADSMTYLMSRHGFEKVVCVPTLFCEYSRPLRLMLAAGKRLAQKPLPNLLYIGRKRYSDRL